MELPWRKRNWRRSRRKGAISDPFPNLLVSVIICFLNVKTCHSARYFNSTACDEPCRNGTFEVMPCSENMPKVCKGKWCELSNFIIIFSVGYYLSYFYIYNIHNLKWQKEYLAKISSSFLSEGIPANVNCDVIWLSVGPLIPSMIELDVKEEWFGC